MRTPHHLIVVFLTTCSLIQGCGSSANDSEFDSRASNSFTTESDLSFENDNLDKDTFEDASTLSDNTSSDNTSGNNNGGENEITANDAPSSPTVPFPRVENTPSYEDVFQEIDLARESPRLTSNSRSISGLWKVNILEHDEYNTVTYQGLILRQTGERGFFLNIPYEKVELTTCAGHTLAKKALYLTSGLNIASLNLSNVPYLPHFTRFYQTGFFNLDRIDYAEPSTSLTSHGRKMAFNPAFDMGEMIIESEIIPNAAISRENCTIVKSQTINEAEYTTISVVVQYEGEPLEVKMEFQLKQGDIVDGLAYSIQPESETALEPDQVRITLSSAALTGYIGQDTISLDNGTLSLDLHNAVWLVGTISSRLLVSADNVATVDSSAESIDTVSETIDPNTETIDSNTETIDSNTETSSLQEEVITAIEEPNLIIDITAELPTGDLSTF